MTDVVASVPLEDSPFASVKLYKSFHKAIQVIIDEVIPFLIKSSLPAFQTMELYFDQLKTS